MSILETKFFYMSILLVSMLFLHFSQKKGSPLNLWNICTILLLGGVLGLRHESVGTDTTNYISWFKLIEGDAAICFSGIMEPGFLYLSYLTIELTGSIQSPFFLWGIVTNALFILRLHELRQHISLSIAILCYILTCYFFEFNIMRQMIAVSIIFYATRWIEKKEYTKFGIASALAMLFHTSAILALGILPFALMHHWKQLSTKVQLLLIFSTGGIIVCFYFVIKYFFSVYGHYLNTDLEISQGSGFGATCKIAAVLLLFFSYGGYKRKKKLPNNEDWELFFHTSSIVFIVALTGNLLSYFIPLIERSILYFSSIGIITLGGWYLHFKFNIIYRCLIVIIASMSFAPIIMQPAPLAWGVFPYKTYLN